MSQYTSSNAPAQQDVTYPEWMLFDLAHSGIAEKRARELGFAPVGVDEYEQILGFCPEDAPEGYAIPFFEPEDGELMVGVEGQDFIRVRFREPIVMRTKGGKESTAKYMSPKGSGTRCYVLPEVHQRLARDWDGKQPLYLTEGEKKAVAGWAHSLPVIGLVGIWGWLESKDERVRGKYELNPDLAEYVSGRQVVMIFDSDANDPRKAGDFENCARRLAVELERHHRATLYRFNMPSLSGLKKVGLDDWFVAGKGIVELSQLIVNRKQRVDTTPTIYLPHTGSRTRNSDMAEEAGEAMADQRAVFCRKAALDQDQGTVCRLNGCGTLREVTPEILQTVIEKHANVVTKRRKKDGDTVDLPDTVSVGKAKVILASAEFQTRLPPLVAVSRCPTLVPEGERLTVNTGYHRATGTYAHGDAVDDLPLREARKVIMEPLADFDFATPSDLSRALAAILTPALVQGGLCAFRVPLNYVEADRSQTGKGLFAELVAAYYNDQTATVNQQAGGGVGGMIETFNSRLVEGHTFVCFDNLLQNSRGAAFDSAELCSFLTQQQYSARGFRCTAVIDPARHVIMATTNGCRLSMDLMNRCNPIVIRKRPLSYSFQRDKDDLIRHVRIEHLKYLGAIFAIIREWHSSGFPRTDTAAHASTFTAWAQSLDWIVRHILGMAPLLDGFAEFKRRTTNPNLSWFRQVIVAAVAAGKLGEWLHATDLAKAASLHNVPLPGLDRNGYFDDLEEWEQKRTLKCMGTAIRSCFLEDGHMAKEIQLDGFSIERNLRDKVYHNHGARLRGLKAYRITKLGQVTAKEHALPHALAGSTKGNKGHQTTPGPLGVRNTISQESHTESQDSLVSLVSLGGVEGGRVRRRPLRTASDVRTFGQRHPEVIRRVFGVAK